MQGVTEAMSSDAAAILLCLRAGISQREVTSFYPVHRDEEEMRRVQSLISGFFSQHIRGRFPEPDCKVSPYLGTCTPSKAHVADFTVPSFRHHRL